MGYGSKMNIADYRIGDPAKLRIPFVPNGKKDVTLVDAMNYLWDTILQFGIRIAVAEAGLTVFRVEDERVTKDSLIEIYYSNDEVTASYSADPLTKIITINFEEALTAETQIAIRVSNPLV